MSVKRRSAANLHILKHLSDSLDHYRQVALQVNSQGQKIWNHQDVPDSSTRQMRHRLLQGWLRLQKRYFDIRQASYTGRGLRHRAHRLISRRHTRSVRKDDNSAVHRYHEHNKVMVKTILLALVGMGMGAMVGLLAALFGAGNLAILLGAAMGGLVFCIVAPRIGRAA